MKTKPPKAQQRIAQMGIEMEGFFTEKRNEYYRNPGAWHAKSMERGLQIPWRLQGDGSVHVASEGYCPETKMYIQGAKVGDKLLPGHNGELVSIPLTPQKLQRFVLQHHPDTQNKSCGTHIHVSLQAKADYNKLSCPDFYFWFMGQAYAWQERTDMDPIVRTEFLRRFWGHNNYCHPNYTECEHSSSLADGWGPCSHECSEECLDTINCSHECYNGGNRDYALRNQREGLSALPLDQQYNTCLVNICHHEHDANCCQWSSCMHYGTNYQHPTGRQEGCNQDNCGHSCGRDNHCFAEQECIHECGAECRSCMHLHDNECRERVPNLGAHTPQVQRRLTSKGSERYAHLNYCEKLHNTIEFRLFPAFKSARVCAEAVKFVNDAIEQYLGEYDDRTQFQLKQRVTKRQFNLQRFPFDARETKLEEKMRLAAEEERKALKQLQLKHQKEAQEERARKERELEAKRAELRKWFTANYGTFGPPAYYRKQYIHTETQTIVSVNDMVPVCPRGWQFYGDQRNYSYGVINTTWRYKDTRTNNKTVLAARWSAVHPDWVELGVSINGSPFFSAEEAGYPAEPTMRERTPTQKSRYWRYQNNFSLEEIELECKLTAHDTHDWRLIAEPAMGTQLGIGPGVSAPPVVREAREWVYENRHTGRQSRQSAPTPARHLNPDFYLVNPGSHPVEELLAAGYSATGRVPEDLYNDTASTTSTTSSASTVSVTFASINNAAVTSTAS